MGLFHFEKIDFTDERIRQIFALRYKVYVEQWQFEASENHPLGLEMDEFDVRAIHIGATHAKKSEFIGTARIIQSSGQGFPIEQHMQLDRPLPKELRKVTGEVSRLAISKEFGRRAEDRVLIDPSAKPGRSKAVLVDRRNPQNDIVMGLIRRISFESRKAGLTYWYVAMARGLAILLRRKGLEFPPIGPELDYHGPRRPYFGKIEKILAKNQELLDIFMGATDLDDDGNPIQNEYLQKLA